MIGKSVDMGIRWVKSAIHVVCCGMALGMYAQFGYTNAPYTRYEADLGTLVSANATSRSYSQSLLQSEASGQICVDFSAAGASVSWNLTSAADGLVLRYSVPDGQSGSVEVFANNVSVGTLQLTTYYSWEYLSTNGDPNNVNVVNATPKMRFDEVRMKLPSVLASGGELKLVRVSGDIHLDFFEMELVPAEVNAVGGDVTYTGDGSNLQTFIDGNGGKTIYLPAGEYQVNRELYFGVNNTKIKGAGSWYTRIHFTNTNGNQGGLRANANGISFSGLYLTTVRNSRSGSYNGINGVFTSASVITDIWTEHFECGAWIGQYNTSTIAYADGFIVSNCRFRNSYADGINLCKGTRNAIVEQCSFRNNGDDDMAIWSANGLECMNNTYRYNTSEHCWRASGCAIYGGYNNKAHNLLIRDNLEVGIRVNNSFPGVGFNDNGMHEFYDIQIQRCGTFNDLYNSPVGAIDLACTNVSGTRIKNVKFTNITITDSKNDAIYVVRRSGGEGFYNLLFENITINGTGREYPDNNINNLNWGRGYMILFVGNPSGDAKYCNMSYSNRGGNAASNINNAQIGTLTWTSQCVSVPSVTVTSSSNFGLCDAIAITATATPPSSNMVSYIEFFVNGQSIGQDNAAPYSVNWNSASAGSHSTYAVAYYQPSNTTSTSYTNAFYVADAIFSTSQAPVIDGTVESLWSNFSAKDASLTSVGAVSGASDLSASFKITRDNTNLYLLIDITDDDLRNDSGNNWEDDAVEVFIDMGNDKSGTYGANDFSYTFAVDNATVYESKHNATAGVSFVQGAKSGGYIFEVAIPWTTLGGAPTANSLMGFDLHVNDDDAGGTRDAKKAWKDNTDNAWQSTAVLGAMQIASCANPLLTDVDVAKNEATIMTFYPNPFQYGGKLKLSHASSSEVQLSLSDLNGKIIQKMTWTGTEELSFGTELMPGVYLLEAFDGEAYQIIRIIKY